jgi:signal transduction histidine kinase
MLFNHLVYAQKINTVDSLQKLLATQDGDTSRVKTLIQLASFLQAINLEQAAQYAKSAVELAKQTGNILLQCDALETQASIYAWQYQTSDALQNYFYALELARDYDVKQKEQKAYDGIAYVYEEEEEWDKALSYSLRSLAIAEQLGDTLAPAYSYHGLSAIYAHTGNYTKAQENLGKAINLFRLYHVNDRLGTCFVDLAKVHTQLHFYNLAGNYFDSAILIFNAIDEPAQLSETYLQKGNMFIADNMPDSALVCFKQARTLFDWNDIAALHKGRYFLGVGKCYFYKKQYNAAAQQLDSSYHFLQQSNPTAHTLDCLSFLAKTDSALGNFKEAFFHLGTRNTIAEKINAEKIKKTAERMLIELDINKKDRETELLKTKYALQSSKLAIIFTSSVLILVGIVLLAFLYNQKTRAFKAVAVLQAQTVTKNDELEKSNNVKDKLLSMIAHDVRSPLSSLHNILILTRENIINKEEFANLSSMLEVDISHLISMLDNTLLWAREQMLDISVKETSFRLVNVVMDVLALYQQTINGKRIQVVNNTHPDVFVFADKDILTTVLRNLISNAIKFTPSEKNIYINQELKDNKIILSVADDGIGIPNDILQKINEHEFVSTRGTSNEKGTGLGLLFSRELLKKAGKDLHIKTIVGKGTTISFAMDVVNDD